MLNFFINIFKSHHILFENLFPISLTLTLRYTVSYTYKYGSKLKIKLFSHQDALKRTKCFICVHIGAHIETKCLS